MIKSLHIDSTIYHHEDGMYCLIVVFNKNLTKALYFDKYTNDTIDIRKFVWKKEI